MNNEDGEAMSLLVGRHGDRFLNGQYLRLPKVFGTAVVKLYILRQGGVLIAIAPVVEGYSFWSASLLGAVLRADNRTMNRRVQWQQRKAHVSVHTLI